MTRPSPLTLRQASYRSDGSPVPPSPQSRILPPQRKNQEARGLRSLMASQPIG